MLTKTLLPIIVFIYCNAVSVFSQDFFTQLEKPETGQGKVNIYQDYKIKKVAELYAEHRGDTKGFRGYRINIFTDSGQGAREGAIQARSKFISHFDDVEVILKPDSPFWRVYVGEFLIKSDARKFLGKITYLFPDAYTIPYYFDLPDD